MGSCDTPTHTVCLLKWSKYREEWSKYTGATRRSFVMPGGCGWQGPRCARDEMRALLRQHGVSTASVLLKRGIGAAGLARGRFTPRARAEHSPSQPRSAHLKEAAENFHFLSLFCLHSQLFSFQIRRSKSSLSVQKLPAARCVRQQRN